MNICGVRRKRDIVYQLVILAVEHPYTFLRLKHADIKKVAFWIMQHRTWSTIIAGAINYLSQILSRDIAFLSEIVDCKKTIATAIRHSFKTASSLNTNVKSCPKWM